MRYRDATAFKAALTARLRKQHPDQDVGRLLKRAMMERFLIRVAEALPDQALLKGGYAIELRLERARATQNLDLIMRDLAAGEVIAALRDAGELELDDHLAFRVQETTAVMPQAAPYAGSRLSVVPLLGGKPFRPTRSTSASGSTASTENDANGMPSLPSASLEGPHGGMPARFGEKLRTVGIEGRHDRQPARLTDRQVDLGADTLPCRADCLPAPGLLITRRRAIDRPGRAGAPF